MRSPLTRGAFFSAPICGAPVAREARPTGSICLTIAVRAGVFSAHPEQPVTVDLDGRPIYTWDFLFENNAERSIKILNLPRSAVNEEGSSEFDVQCATTGQPLDGGNFSRLSRIGVGVGEHPS